MTENKPLKTIALCLSGGGFRAAAFHLGTIDMLDELDLLENVKLLSTVSGGTIVGAYYAVQKINGTSYEDFYNSFYKFLNEENIIQKGFDKLKDWESPNGLNDLSLIRGAAQVYDEKLFHQKRVKELFDKNSEPKFFKELIFNTTEFRFGQSFRFRLSHKSKITIGSDAYRITKDVVQEIRIADIVASSSCFPSVFEPIRFPDDFYWESPLDEIRQKLKSGFRDQDGNFVRDKSKDSDSDDEARPMNLPLMDGGVFDNQGIDSIINAGKTEEAKTEKPEADLFIISDTNQRSDLIYKFPVSEHRGKLKLYQVWWLLIALFLSAIVSLAGLLFETKKFFETTTEYDLRTILFAFFVYFVPIICLTGVCLTGAFLRNLMSKHRVIEVKGERFEVWDYLKNLTISDAVQFGKGRILSLVAMSTDIFMKRIRGLQTSTIKADTLYSKLVAFNFIYDLNSTNKRTTLWEIAPNLKPTGEMTKCSIDAEKVSTSLWFVNEQELKKLIVCGQITLCHSLLKYLIEECGTDPQDENSSNYELYKKIEEKWEKMIDDIHIFLNRKR